MTDQARTQDKPVGPLAQAELEQIDAYWPVGLSDRAEVEHSSPAPSAAALSPATRPAITGVIVGTGSP